MGKRYIEKKTEERNKDIEILDAIEETIKELEMARSLFDNVQDNYLIEIAIYSETVAKKRYAYLLLLAKERGLKVDGQYILRGGN